MLKKEDKKILKDIAKKSLELYIRKGDFLDFETEKKSLLSQQGAFVTLKKNSELRGCIGLVTSNMPLWKTVRDMSIAAGSQDDRFTPVTEKDLNDLEYEISILTPFEKIDDWKSIEPGRHGVLIKSGNKSGLFLPQVAKDNNWSLEELLKNLCHFKAGLEPEAYKNDPEIEIYVFEAEIF
jgi:AmmeMemoRadiSam system protein A